jgi:site-specific DNA-methyltransferase (adenine-specific)
LVVFMRIEHIGDAVLYCGDCRDVLPTLPENSVDSIVTDPPYGLKFMGKAWDHGVPGVEFWEKALRVAKPGAHLLAFGGTRTFHRLTCAIEDAGWEIRDCIMWVYGSGFPKSHNVSLSIDKKLGGPDRGHRIATASRSHPDGTLEPNGEQLEAYEAKMPEAAEWEGWGTALKPSWEPIIVARKPLEGTVAENVMKYRTGAINVDGCRVDVGEEVQKGNGQLGKNACYGNMERDLSTSGINTLGRWPANLIHDGSEEVIALFPEEFGSSAARFFYCAKASKEDRDEGLDGFDEKNVHSPSSDGRVWDIPGSHSGPKKNNHPTVKPTDLMRYLVRLVTPPGGTCLDMFMGSGSTGKSCKMEGFGFIGIDLEDEHVDIAAARIKHAHKITALQLKLFDTKNPAQNYELEIDV